MPQQTVADYGVGLDLLTGNFNRQLDGFIGATAKRIAGLTARLSAFVSAPLALIGRSMSELATDVDLAAREATALMTSSFKDLFSPEAQEELEKRYEEIITRALDLSIEYGATAASIIESVYFAIGTGFPSLEDAYIVVEQATMAAAAGGTDAATAIDVLLGTINAYNLSAQDAKYVSDILFQTVNVGKVEFEELAQTMGDILGIAPLLGMNLEEVGAIISAATLSGNDAAQSFTGLRQVMLNIFGPRAAAAKELAKFWDVPRERVGLFIGEMIKARGFLPVFREIVKATAVDPITGAFDAQKARLVFKNMEGLARILPMFVKMTDEEAAAIEELNLSMDAGVSVTDALAAATTRLDKYYAETGKEQSLVTRGYLAMMDAQRGVGATTAAYSEVAKSLSLQSDIATRSIEALKIVLGLELKAALLPIIQTVGKLALVLSKLPDSTKRVIVIIGIISALLPPLLFGLSMFVSFISVLGSVIVGLISFALNPLVLALGYLFFSSVKAKIGVRELAEGADEATTPFLKLTNVILSIAETVTEAIRIAADVIVWFVNFLRQAATRIAEFFGAEIVAPEIEAAEVEEQATGIPDERKIKKAADRAAREARLAGRETAVAYAEGVEEGPEPELPVPDAAEVEHVFFAIGRAAIRSMLRAMDPETFDIFRDSLDLVRGEVQALGLDAEQTGIALHNAQIALAQALLGNMGAWETLRSIIGDAVDLIQEYVAARKAAAAADAAVEQAELNRRRELEQLDAKIAAIREKIRQFELDTAEIPERYTRGRRRQLDEELNAAQKERDARAKVLDAQVTAAKEQAKAAREHAQHLAELMRLELAMIEKRKEEAEIAKTAEEQWQEMMKQYDLGGEKVARITEAFETLGETFSNLELLLKGLFGEILTPEQLAELTEEEKLAYQRGMELRQALEGIAGAFGDIKGAVLDLVDALGQIWDQVPDWMKIVVAGGITTMYIGLKLIGAVAFVASVSSAVTAAGVGAIAAAGATAASIAAIAIPVAAIAIALGGVAIAAYDVQETLKEGYDVVGESWRDYYKKVEEDAQSADSALELLLMKHELVQEEYQHASPIARLLIAEEDLYADIEATQRLLIGTAGSWDEYRLAVERYNVEAAKIPAMEELELLPPEEFTKISEAGELLGDDLIGGYVKAVLAGAQEAAVATEALTEPTVEAFVDMSDEIVGESIVPEMVDTTLGEFERMATGSELILTGFSEWIYTWGGVTAQYWYTFWNDLAMYTIETVNMMEVSVTSALARMTAAMAAMFDKTIEAAKKAQNRLTRRSIIPDMVDEMEAEFWRAQAAGESAFTSLFQNAIALAQAGALGLTEPLASMESQLSTLALGGGQLVPAVTGAAAPGVGEVSGVATFTITNHWDASVTEKDREELEAVSRQTTYEAIVEAYSGGGEVRHE